MVYSNYCDDLKNDCDEFSEEMKSGRKKTIYLSETPCRR